MAGTGDRKKDEEAWKTIIREVDGILLEDGEEPMSEEEIAYRAKLAMDERYNTKA